MKTTKTPKTTTQAPIGASPAPSRVMPFERVAEVVRIAATDWDIVSMPASGRPCLELFHDTEQRPAYIWDFSGDDVASSAQVSAAFAPERRRGWAAPTVIVYSAAGFTPQAQGWAPQVGDRNRFRAYTLSAPSGSAKDWKLPAAKAPADGELLDFIRAAFTHVEDGRKRVPKRSQQAAPHTTALPNHEAWRGARVVGFHTQFQLPNRRIELLRGAEKSVWLSTFTHFDHTVTDALVFAAKQGRDVRVLLHAGSKDGVSRRNDEVHRTLSEANVQVFRLKMHAKCLVVDGRYVLLGSQNCSRGQKVEFTLEFDDATFAGFLVATLEAHASAASREPSPRKRRAQARRGQRV